jgi:hypothetical protein
VTGRGAVSASETQVTAKVAGLSPVRLELLSVKHFTLTVGFKLG